MTPGLLPQVEAEAEELKEAKAAIKENEKQQMEERAEAAAQRMLLEEDAELRKAIQVRVGVVVSAAGTRSCHARTLALPTRAVSCVGRRAREA